MIHQEIWDEIITLITNGATNKDALQYCGVSEETFYNKLKEDNEFNELVKKAQIGFKLQHINRVNKASAVAWQASAWMLERKFKDEFALKTEHDHTTGGEKMNIFVAPSPEIAEQINKRMAELHATDKHLPTNTESISEATTDNT